MATDPKGAAALSVLPSLYPLAVTCIVLILNCARSKNTRQKRLFFCFWLQEEPETRTRRAYGRPLPDHGTTGNNARGGDTFPV